MRVGALLSLFFCLVAVAQGIEMLKNPDMNGCPPTGSAGGPVTSWTGSAGSFNFLGATSYFTNESPSDSCVVSMNTGGRNVLTQTVTIATSGNYDFSALYSCYSIVVGEQCIMSLSINGKNVPLTGATIPGANPTTFVSATASGISLKAGTYPIVITYTPSTPSTTTTLYLTSTSLLFLGSGPGELFANPNMNGCQTTNGGAVSSWTGSAGSFNFVGATSYFTNEAAADVCVSSMNTGGRNVLLQTINVPTSGNYDFSALYSCYSIVVGEQCIMSLSINGNNVPLTGATIPGANPTTFVFATASGIPLSAGTYPIVITYTPSTPSTTTTLYLTFASIQRSVSVVGELLANPNMNGCEVSEGGPVTSWTGGVKSFAVVPSFFTNEAVSDTCQAGLLTQAGKDTVTQTVMIPSAGNYDFSALFGCVSTAVGQSCTLGVTIDGNNVPLSGSTLPGENPTTFVSATAPGIVLTAGSHIVSAKFIYSVNAPTTVLTLTSVSLAPTPPPPSEIFKNPIMNGCEISEGGPVTSWTGGVKSFAIVPGFFTNEAAGDLCQAGLLTQAGKDTVSQVITIVSPGNYDFSALFGCFSSSMGQTCTLGLTVDGNDVPLTGATNSGANPATFVSATAPGISLTAGDHTVVVKIVYSVNSPTTVLALTTVSLMRTGSGSGDPHMVGFQGQQFDYIGEAGQVINLVSDPDLQVNSLLGLMKAGEHTFIPGPVMMEMAFMTRGHTVSINAGGYLKEEIGFVTVDGVSLPLGQSFLDGILSVAFTALNTNSRYLGLTGNDHIVAQVDLKLEGLFEFRVFMIENGRDPKNPNRWVTNFPRRFLDFNASLLDLDRRPHGILGQTAAPLSKERSVGEWTIEGKDEDYVVKDGLTGTLFTFNQFQ